MSRVIHAGRYEVYAPGGTEPPRSLSAVTTKDDLLYLFTASATDKQWAKSKALLGQLVDSFRA